MANSNPIKGSDLKIKIKLSYNQTVIRQGVTFEIASFDSYNHGKIWKFPVPEAEVTAPGEDGYWEVMFRGSKQKFTGWYNVCCTIDLEPQFELENVEVVSFKHAFYLEDQFLPNTQEEVLQPMVIDVPCSDFTGTLSTFSLVKSVDYDEGTMKIYVTFSDNTSIVIDAHDVFPFRLVSNDEWGTFPIEDNVFYYTYDGEKPQFSISASVDPAGSGTVTGTGIYDLNATCTLVATAMPNSGYHFVNWTLDGVEVSTNPSYSFQVSMNKSFVAHFSGTPSPAFDIVDGVLVIRDNTIAYIDEETGTLIITEGHATIAEDGTLILS